MLFIPLLAIGSWKDIKLGILPDWVTIGGMFVGFLMSSAYPLIQNCLDPYSALVASLQGALIGSGSLLWIAILGERTLRREVMGFGDIKLMGFIGAFIGWEGAIFTIFIGSVIACILVLPLYILLKNGTFRKTIPFGPFLSAASLLYSWWILLQ